MEISHRIEKDLCLVTLIGNLIWKGEDVLGDHLKTIAEEPNLRGIIFDFTEVEYVDSSSLGLLISQSIKFGKKQIEFALCAPNQQTQQTFRLARLETVMKLCNNEQEALDYFKVQYLVSERKIRLLFHHLKDYHLGVKLWVARFLGGIIIADHIIDRKEVLYLQAIFDNAIEEPTIRQTLTDVLQENEVPEMEPLEVAPDVAEHIIQCALDICSSDYELHRNETRLIEAAAQALGLDTIKIYELVDRALMKIKFNSFEKLLIRLDRKGQYWLAVVILKLIYADETIAPKETIYLSDIYELLDDPAEIFNKIQEDTNYIELSELPDVNFQPELTADIMHYLVTIALVDGDYDPREEAFLQQVSQTLNYGESRLTDLIQGLSENYMGY